MKRTAVVPSPSSTVAVRPRVFRRGSEKRLASVMATRAVGGGVVPGGVPGLSGGVPGGIPGGVPAGASW